MNCIMRMALFTMKSMYDDYLLYIHTTILCVKKSMAISMNHHLRELFSLGMWYKQLAS
jgi:hypothetical protein